MSKTTILYILIAFFIAIFVAYFYYFYKNKDTGKENYGLSLLRFFSVFLLLLLFINPKISTQKTNVIKPNLVVAVDNSASINYFKSAKKVQELVSKIQKSTALNEKFDIAYYSFGKTVNIVDSLSFSEKQSNLATPLQQLDALYKDKIAPILFITDGNQTIGNDYEFFKSKQAIYTVTVGDTVQKLDAKITQLNANKYTFLKNTFPVEVFLNCSTKKSINTTFTVFEGATKVYTKKVLFDATNTAKTISFKLPANRVGKHFYRAELGVLKNEHNTLNNSHRFVVEVVDEKVKILLLTSFLHPDIGMLKRSIESNPQREVIIKKITDYKSTQFKEYQSVILYQPTNDFATVFKQLQQEKKHYFVITGSKTDWHFLNTAQPYFKKEAIAKTEQYLPVFNDAYDTFLIDAVNFESFPPLVATFGEISFSIPKQTLLKQKIGSFTSETPLLATFEDGTFRGATLFGENSWKWRMYTEKEKKSAISFDVFVGKIVQYLSDTQNKKRLSTQNKPFYYANQTITITADYVDKNYVFDPKATIWLTVYNKKNNIQKKHSFFVENNTYKVRLTNLPSGTYSYTVTVENQPLKSTGSFQIIPFEIEQLFTNANVDKLQNLASNNHGKNYFLDTTEPLFVNFSKQDNAFKSIQKKTIEKTPLIDWKWLLGFIVLFLSIEWFARKYFGKI